MKLDRYGAQAVIDWAHHEVHAEYLQGVSISATINSAATLALHITVAAGKKLHFEAVISSNKSGTIIFREGDTITGGDAVVAYNHFRGSLKTASSVIKKDATVSAAGTVLKTIVIGSSAPSTRIGGEAKTGAEYVLAASTTYTIIFTSAENTNTVAINADFYEE